MISTSNEEKLAKNFPFVESKSRSPENNLSIIHLVLRINALFLPLLLSSFRFKAGDTEQLQHDYPLEVGARCVPCTAQVHFAISGGLDKIIVNRQRMAIPNENVGRERNSRSRSYHSGHVLVLCIQNASSTREHVKVIRSKLKHIHGFCCAVPHAASPPSVLFLRRPFFPEP